MTPTDARPPAALDAAIHKIRDTAAAVALRVADLLGAQIQVTGIKIAERELLHAAQIDLRRNMAVFQSAFHEALREKVGQQLSPRTDNRRKLDSADWQSLSLVEDREVEERMNFVRLGQMISHECDWQLRDLAAYMGSVLGNGRADDESNPLRAEVVGSALYRAIESVSNDRESRKILTREFGHAMAQAMPACYADILRSLQERGVQPVHLTVRTVEGPGNQLGGAVNSGYTTAREGRNSSNSAFGDLAGGDDDLLSAHRRALAQAFPGFAAPDSGHGAITGRGPVTLNDPGTGLPRRPDAPVRDSGRGDAPSGRSDFARSSHAGGRARGEHAADAELMTLLRRLATAQDRAEDASAAAVSRGGAPLGTSGDMASVLHSGDLQRGLRSGSGGLAAQRAQAFAADSASPGIGAPSTGPGSVRGPITGSEPGGQLTQLMAVNLIRAHREELMKASTGKLDHMVIDVVGSLFDQILSDSKVPPQMAREIARLQLPVLRVALNDSTFFSTRRHPVRRFVNRIASLACAFDDFGAGPGAEFLGQVRKLVDDIVQGDFDQIDLYAAKVSELESFVARQTEGEVEQTGAATTLDAKESELRVQQRYMLQLRAALAPLPLPNYLQDFLPQVWSQAMVLATRRDGPESDRAKRFRRVGVDLVMSVQPKGSPTLRKKFLMQLPTLMKDLNEGMQLIGWPDAARKEFFGKLLPAHAESLKGQPLSELDYNLLVKQLEAVFAIPVPTVEAFSRIDTLPEVDTAVIEQRFTPEEVAQVGLVSEKAIDWSEKVELAAPAEPATPQAAPEPVAPAATIAAVDPEAESPPTPGESGAAPEPVPGAQLIDHIKLGFAYQMHLKNEWQKVRLAHVSSGRSFFVFTRGGKHHETISMTSRMVARMCETGRLRAFENEYLMERATHRARKQLAELSATTTRS
ncbi:DUF1631 family protein [Piscinibacter koreensis]|uniref:DUF1631 family protein n=1 Tax=Piscinibacter koreensis TaxID=2742824 RepID=A0A7Y6TW84_9BURK|nr:DUF1631 family protein [Schlegelella koreensis]NUZ05736.1 DUF1631 family protein [Schlegelella koreensis]